MWWPGLLHQSFSSLGLDPSDIISATSPETYLLKVFLLQNEEYSASCILYMRKKTPFWCHLLKVYASESEVWEHSPRLPTHSDIYRTVLFLTEMAQSRSCLLSYQAREAPTHSADTASVCRSLSFAWQKRLGIPNRRKRIPSVAHHLKTQQKNDFYSRSTEYQSPSKSQISHLLWGSDQSTPQTDLSKSAQFQRFQSGNLSV